MKEKTEKERLDEIKAAFRSELVRSSFPIYPKGGQSCGMPVKGVTLTHSELGFSISICYHRSQIRNIEAALLFFDLFLDDIVY